MGTKLYIAGLGALLAICLAIGFDIGYSHVFAAGAYQVPHQSVAQVPPSTASAPAHSG
ncbi:hypothetical protein [Thiomonas bhubaneswarensis]|uniref:Uncharacterized protein n=1 Tax=Thiomonas bhubaneswarensis TaxID=339866 RepID=A0A0K6HZ74_9BURK|nr:hypothetical protein [Thiomonas bhubaneswarensis]CUA96219.1 hypothetical protein Ga0061069_10451 [Thiomonas bhubaneswarensis]